MPLVFYTNREFQTPMEFRTEDFCAANQDAVEKIGDVAVKVEEFLEQVRRSEFPEAPDRMCSISAQPWPERGTPPPGRKHFVKFRMPDPPPPPEGAAFCYYIDMPNGSHRWFVDEDWVRELTQRWPHIRGTAEAKEIAMAYWGGEIGRFYGVSYLIQGEVLVEDVCLG